ncbi:FG-GAP-like repeat-containing protein, partial [Microcoleus sp. BROC3]|uniref:FG-GAP-like repeat-containing protein n=1 Tax=Microcoleus sp. BROC3 TaxID=3055323 RepID=UPI002FD266CB
MPTFNAPVTNPNGLIDVGSMVTPFFVDIDNDGDLDALGGGYFGIYYYRNSGTASVPSFDAPQANPFGINILGSYTSPTFADIDNDGDLDAFVGVQNGITYYYRNSGTASAPSFDAPQGNPFGLTDVGWAAAPTFADIDNDGDLEAFVGARDGNTYYYQNTGTLSAPTFAAPQVNPNGLTGVGNSASPTLADIDNDGDLDAFVGASNGNTFYYQNTGTVSAPFFAAPQANPYGFTDVGSLAAPTLADIDNDGDLDAFVGAQDGNTYYYQNIDPVATIAAGTAPSEAEPTAPVTGNFVVTLSTAATSDTTITYTVGGTATSGADYTALTGSVTILTGQATANINVTPLLDSIPDAGETVTLTLTPGTGYNVGASKTATLSILDQASQTFSTPVTNPNGLTPVGNSASPTFADIDNDGDLDAFVGADDGNTYYYKNTGTASAPTFDLPVANFTNVGFRAAPTLADIDSDGDLDAFVGADDGNTYYYKNTGTASAPTFDLPVAN